MRGRGGCLGGCAYDAPPIIQLDCKAVLLLPLDAMVLSWIAKRCTNNLQYARRAEAQTPEKSSGVYWHKKHGGFIAKRMGQDMTDEAASKYKLFKVDKEQINSRELSYVALNWAAKCT